MSHDHADVKSLAELKALCAQHKVVLVDFHATWCGPCKAIAPYVVNKCQTSGVFLVKVDVDQAEELAAAYQVQAMPTFKVLGPKGEEIAGVVGGGQPNVNKMI